MDRDAASSPPDACGRCGCPLVGNEIYCSACGRRLAPADRKARTRLAIGAAALAAMALAGAWETRSCREPPSRAITPATTPIRIRG